MEENKEKELNVNEEILHYKKLNNRNNTIIIGLLVVLLIVCIITIYVRFF